jgi:hypothetical protein
MFGPRRAREETEMQGTRLTKIEGEDDYLYRIAQTPGAYGSADGKDWFCTTPNGLFGNISKHTVKEHEDGTITVSPSILVTSGRDHGQPNWHGYLERGVWREC